MIDFLAKIQQSQWMEDKYYNEYLFFKYHSDFRTLPKDGANTGMRFDSRDGNLVHRQIKDLELITQAGEKIKLIRKYPESHAEYTERLENPLINNCSFAKISFDNDLNFDSPSERLMELGDSALLIYDIDKFFQIIDSSILSMGLEYSRGTVIYYDHRRYDGNLSYLHKDVEYSFQNEYRILIGPNSQKIDLKVAVPGLKEIAIIVSTKDLYLYTTYSEYFFLSKANNNGKL